MGRLLDSLKKVKLLVNANFYRYNLSRIFTIAEKNVKLQARFKFSLISRLLFPIISIIMPLIIMSKLFVYGSSFGRWDEQNFSIFLLIAYNIDLLQRIIQDFPNGFEMEKFWKTLPALMIAPFNRFHLLFGIFFTHLIIISIPFTIFTVLALILFPISFGTFICIIIIYLLIDLVFSGIGLFLGVFAIAKENLYALFNLGVFFLFWASCLTYPIEIFPGFIQQIIVLNPFYYIFDVLRATWVDNNIFLTISTYPFHFLVLVGTGIIIPFVGVYFFNKIYKKYGIVGY